MERRQGGEPAIVAAMVVADAFAIARYLYHAFKVVIKRLFERRKEGMIEPWNEEPRGATGCGPAGLSLHRGCCGWAVLS